MAEREIMIGGRRLSQLKVDELKVELERRGLRKSGNKGILIERLQEAIDKELEQKEGYESFSVPQQTHQQPVANAWPHALMQQQQQQQRPDGFQVQSMGIQQQSLLNQPQGMHNQPHVMMNQHQLMINQQQQITSPVQVKEFREQWPQAQMPQTQLHGTQSQIPQAQVLHSQVPQPQMPPVQMLQSQVQQAQMPPSQIPQPQMLYHHPQENQRLINQMTSIPEPAPLTHPPNEETQPHVEPEADSPSSSASDSAQQSSSSSSADTDDHEQQQRKSLLNDEFPVEQKPAIEEKNSEESPYNMESQEDSTEKATLENEAEEKLIAKKTLADEEMRPPVESKEEEGEVKEEGEEENTLPEEKEKEAEDEKENEPPEETMQQQPSPDEENTFEVEPSEEDKAVVEEPKVPSPPKSASPIVTKKRKISIPRTSLPSTPTSDGQPGSRKRRWGSSSSKKKTSLSISTDSLKDLIPGVQVHSTPALEAVMDLGGDDDDEKEIEDEEKKTEEKAEEEKDPAPVKTPETPEPENKKRKERIVKVEEKKTIKLQRKPIVIEKEQETIKMEVEEEAETPISDNPHPRRTSAPLRETSPIRAERSPSPSTHPESEVLHVKNLVRPFTLNQLKELLGKHGTLAEDGFWIDKIKSHCYVVYNSVEEAAASRQALHGIKWPTTSPKILAVDFADNDEMARDTEGALGKTKGKERESKLEKVVKKDRPVVEEKPAAEVEEEEEDQKNAGNLLDNLFRKTKTTPCLYWLPLSDEQIATREREREERRKARQEEIEKENKERKERQEQREKEREKEKREREQQKQRSRSPRNTRRERSRSKSRSRSRSPRGPRRR